MTEAPEDAVPSVSFEQSESQEEMPGPAPLPAAVQQLRLSGEEGGMRESRSNSATLKGSFSASSGSVGDRRRSSNREWEEVDHNDIEIIKTIGHGAYGVVKKAVWKGKVVAIKYIENETAIKEFQFEVRQLARVRHENIVKLYGACMTDAVCLLMEFAENGSLYSLLHNSVRVRYTAGHAVSWCLQCAKGVAYLHDLKMVHRDLKPPNLLLTEQGQRVKICDFGTVTDLKTYMTNNKGSAAWMAPEVFEGRRYSDKCDSFSWGIILWETLSRRKPFEEIGGGPFRIMWAIHSGRRPPLITGCPKPLEIIMTECWLQDPERRPAMAQIVSRMSAIQQYFGGGDEPITFPSPEEMAPLEAVVGFEDFSDPAEATVDCGDPAETTVMHGEEGEPVPLLPPPSFNRSPKVIEDPSPSPGPSSVQQSAPPSLYNSSEDLSPRKTSVPLHPVSPLAQDIQKGHKRTSSYDTALLGQPQNPTATTSGLTPQGPRSSKGPTQQQGAIHPMAAAVQREDLRLPIASPHLPAHMQFPNGKAGSPEFHRTQSPSEMLRAYSCIEPHLQPHPPDPKNEESMKIFYEHCLMADEYIRVNEEVKLLLARKNELMQSLSNSISEEGSQSRLVDEYNARVEERDKLLQLRSELQRKLDDMRPSA